MNTIAEVWSWLDQGPVMWALHGIAVISLAAALDRMLYWMVARTSGLSLAQPHKGPVRCSAKVLSSLVATGRRRDYLARIARAAGGEHPVLANARIALRGQIQEMNSHLGTLDLAIVIAPLLGILGTVVGIAQAFGSGTSSALPSPATLGAGVGLALKTTMWGLSISILAAGSRFVFRGFTAKAVVNIHNLLELIEDASGKTASGPPGTD